MRKFTVNVNGNMYSVEVEEVEAGAFSAPAASVAPAPAPVAAAPQAAPKAAAKPVVSGGTQVNSPMPGTVLKLAVANGATVAKGQKLLVLEAMKMENDINANADGVVTFTVKEGDSVESGACLAVIK